MNQAKQMKADALTPIVKVEKHPYGTKIHTLVRVYVNGIRVWSKQWPAARAEKLARDLREDLADNAVLLEIIRTHVERERLELENAEDNFRDAQRDLEIQRKDAAACEAAFSGLLTQAGQR